MTPEGEKTPSERTAHQHNCNLDLRRLQLLAEAEGKGLGEQLQQQPRPRARGAKMPVQGKPRVRAKTVQLRGLPDDWLRQTLIDSAQEQSGTSQRDHTRPKDTNTDKERAGMLEYVQKLAKTKT